MVGIRDQLTTPSTQPSIDQFIKPPIKPVKKWNYQSINDAMHIKYHNLIRKQNDRIQRLERAIARLHSNHNELEMKSRRGKVCVENIS